MAAHWFNIYYMNYFIYTLDYKGIPFYVGKTINIKTRLRKHKMESKLKRTHKEKMINKILLNNEDISISIIDEVVIGTENYWEEFWISQIKSWDIKLYNGTSGGEGGDYWSGKNHTEETKDKLRRIRFKQIEEGKVYRSIGESNGRSKLKSDDVIEMRDLRENGYSFNRLAIKYNISKATVIDIIKRKKWKHI